MRLFLFGGGFGEVKYFEDILNSLDVKEILHIPFARTGNGEGPWEGDWFNRNIKLKHAQYFNAQKKEDIALVTKPLILLSGGRQSARLLEKIQNDSILLKLIHNADYIVAESAGAKILGEYVRVGDDKVQFGLVKGLGIVKDTIIEPHYFEKDRVNLLKSEIEEKNVKYGLGIESVSGIEFDPLEFPDKYNKLGEGVFRIIKN